MSVNEPCLYKDAAQPVEKRVEDLLSKMTLDEKIAELGSCWVYQVLHGESFSVKKAEALLSKGLGQITRLGGGSSMEPQKCAQIGNEIQRFLMDKTRLGIPAIIHEEACSGLMAKGATCFPQTIGLSCTWNPELSEAMGNVIRTQMRALGAHQALAPLLDVTRDPRWGRVEETFGEDPYLVSRMGVSYIKGLQDKSWENGVMATGKHFVGYGISEGGLNWAPAHIPERELREVFLAPFEAAVKEGGIASIMNGYHELDGIPCGASKALLNDVLREQWGFEGLVVSDYLAINMLYDYHHIAKDKIEAAKLALEAGIDIELPFSDCYGAPLKEAVEKGIIPEAVVNRSVARSLGMKFKLGLFENPFVDTEKTSQNFDTPEQRKLAYKIAQQSIVLLKNENNLLPLDKNIGSIAVIGPNADNVRNLIGDYAYPCHIEYLVDAAEVDNTLGMPLPDKLELEDNFVPIRSLLAGLKEKLGAGTKISFAEGCKTLHKSRDGFAEAVEAAKKSDVAIIFVGDKAGLISDCTVGESRDRAEINLPGVQEELVRAVYETGTPVVVVLVNGRPFSINWIDEHIPAVLEAWLPGEEGAGAVADVIFGDYNPGGKLTMSVPRSSGQIPVFYNHKKSGGRSHWTGNYVDLPVSPLYPFGYGLSYTKFEYGNIVKDREKVGINGQIEISVDIRNAGNVDGDEIVQLYINDGEASVTRPVKELKGFRRVSVPAGESRKVVFTILSGQLGFYNRDMEYIVEPGTIHVMVGGSSDDIKLSTDFEITGRAETAQKAFFSEVKVI